MWATHKTHSLRHTIRTRSRPRRLNFTGIQLCGHRPRSAIRQCNHEYRDYHDPSADAVASVYARGGVERANGVHGCCQDDAAGEDRDAAADAVGEDDGWDGDD